MKHLPKEQNGAQKLHQRINEESLDYELEADALQWTNGRAILVSCRSLHCSKMKNNMLRSNSRQLMQHMQESISQLQEKHKAMRLRRNEEASRLVESQIVQQQRLLNETANIIDSFDSMQNNDCVFEPKILVQNAIEVVSVSRLSPDSSIKLRTDPCLPQEV